jgi:hypothetical protein
MFVDTTEKNAASQGFARSIGPHSDRTSARRGNKYGVLATSDYFMQKKPMQNELTVGPGSKIPKDK